MITINLLPLEYRRQETKRSVSVAPIFFVVVFIILVLHALLGLFGLYKKMQLQRLEQAWAKIEPQQTEINKVKSEVAEKKNKVEALQGLIERKIYWTDFFNAVNRAVPKGLWLNRLNISDQGLVIEGSVFSFNIDQISLVNKFFDELKKDSFSQENFVSFSLDSVQRRSIKQYDILDFVLTAKFKNR